MTTEEFLLQIDIASPSSPLSMFFYATYNETDFEALEKQYGIPGFDKPNATKYAHPVSKSWMTKLTGLYTNKSESICVASTAALFNSFRASF